MSWQHRETLLVAIGGAVLIALSFLAQRRPHAPPSASGPSASASSAPSPNPVTPPVPPGSRYIFDCASFAAAEPTACPTPPSAESTLLNLVNTYRVSAVPCSSWPGNDQRAAEAALNAVAKLDPKALAVLDRALLQNAVLHLLACSPKVTRQKQYNDDIAGMPLAAQAMLESARKLVTKFALSDAEVATLPVSTALLPAWLGDAASWKRGIDPRFLHTSSDGFTRAHQRLQQGNTLSDIVRLVLVDKAGAPHVSDVIERVVLRRMAADGVHACIAELSPTPASCGPAALRALDAERGQSVLAGGPGNPPCQGCHGSNRPGSSAPFGPDTGFQLSSASSARIQSALASLLHH